MKISIQLYSLKDIIKEKGFKNVLAEVKALGFDGVEFAGFHCYSAAELKQYLDSIDLQPMGAHIRYELLKDGLDQVISDALALGLRNITLPVIGLDYYLNNQKEFVDTLTIAAEKLSRHDIVLSYHNHAHEFVDGIDYVKKFIDEVENLYLELDIFWLTAANINVNDYLEEAKDKIRLIHLKEMSEKGKDEPNPIVGKGVVNADKVIKFAKSQKIDWIVLEVENFAVEPFKYLKESLDYIKKQISLTDNS